MNLKEIRNPKVLVQLDKERSLRFDLNAFAEIEEKFGDIDQAMNLVEAGNVKAIRFVVWAGLIHEDENLSEKEVGRMIDAYNLPAVSVSLIQALTGSLPTVAIEGSNARTEQEASGASQDPNA